MAICSQVCFVDHALQHYFVVIYLCMQNAAARRYKLGPDFFELNTKFKLLHIKPLLTRYPSLKTERNSYGMG